jgi:hypothetical protein
MRPNAGRALQVALKAVEAEILSEDPCVQMEIEKERSALSRAQAFVGPV